MVYLVLTRNGYEAVVSKCEGAPSPMWLNKNVLTQPELETLRAAGVEVSNFTRAITPTDRAEVEAAADTVQEHHPDASVWVEYVPAS